jgi:hypothetical protein
LTVGQFCYVIRKRIKLAPEKAIFIFVNEVLPPTAALMSSIYEEHKDDDGFLYITYASFVSGLTVGMLARIHLGLSELLCFCRDRGVCDGLLGWYWFQGSE